MNYTGSEQHRAGLLNYRTYFFQHIVGCVCVCVCVSDFPLIFNSTGHNYLPSYKLAKCYDERQKLNWGITRGNVCQYSMVLIRYQVSMCLISELVDSNSYHPNHNNKKESCET